MRILYLNHNVAWSGTFFRAFHLGRQLVEQGHDVTLVTTHPSNRLGFATANKDGVNLVYSPDLFWGSARQGWDPTNVLRRLWYLNGGRWDLVHAFDSRPVVVIPGRRVHREVGAIFVMDWADWWGRGGTIEERSGWLVRTFFGPIETWFEESFRRQVDGTTVISDALASRAESLGVLPDTILKLPHGCDVTRFPIADRGLARSRLGMSASEHLVVHVGTLFRGDGDLLFDAFRHLLKRRDDIRLVLVGKSRTPPPKDLVDRGVVIQTGLLSYEELQAWLGAADMCVLPLRNTVANQGRWPSKINDYLAAARPVVMTRVGDSARIVEGAEAGWTADPDPRALSDVMASTLGDPAALQRAGENARRVAESDLAWPRLARMLESFYLGLAERRTRSTISPQNRDGTTV